LSTVEGCGRDGLACRGGSDSDREGVGEEGRCGVDARVERGEAWLVSWGGKPGRQGTGTVSRWRRVGVAGGWNWLVGEGSRGAGDQRRGRGGLSAKGLDRFVDWCGAARGLARLVGGARHGGAGSSGRRWRRGGKGTGSRSGSGRTLPRGRDGLCSRRVRGSGRVAPGQSSAGLTGAGMSGRRRRGSGWGRRRAGMSGLKGPGLSEAAVRAEAERRRGAQLTRAREGAASASQAKGTACAGSSTRMGPPRRGVGDGTP
jgi:hypothetical protein